jgi:hypothetical protein
MPHNIYEAFLYKYKKYIVALSYTPGLDVNNIITDLQETFNLTIIKLDGDELLTSDAKFDYDSLNNKVDKLLTENDFKLKTNLDGYYGKGILIHGLFFPPNKLTFRIDLQIHISLTVTQFLKSNLDKGYTIDNYNNFKTLLETNKINKYFNVRNEINNELNDSIYNKIIDWLEYKIYGPNYELYASKNKNNSPPIDKDKLTQLDESSENDRIRSEKEDDSIDASLSLSSDKIMPVKKKNRYLESDSDSDSDSESEKSLNSSEKSLSSSEKSLNSSEKSLSSSEKSLNSSEKSLSSSEELSDLDSIEEFNNFSEQNGGGNNSYKSELIKLTNNELEKLIKFLI